MTLTALTCAVCVSAGVVLEAQVHLIKVTEPFHFRAGGIEHAKITHQGQATRPELHRTPNSTTVALANVATAYNTIQVSLPGCFEGYRALLAP